jgi:hypothetical protein
VEQELLTLQGRRTDNTMAKEEEKTPQWPRKKNRQHNGQGRRTDNTMTKGRRTDNTMAKRILRHSGFFHHKNWSP